MSPRRTVDTPQSRQFSQEDSGLLSKICMSPTVTPAGGPRLRADQDLVLIGMFLLGCGVLLVREVLHVQVTPDALCTMLLLCPMLVMTKEDWSALVAGLPAVILGCLLGATLIFRPRRRT